MLVAIPLAKCEVSLKEEVIGQKIAPNIPFKTPLCKLFHPLYLTSLIGLVTIPEIPLYISLPNPIAP